MQIKVGKCKKKAHVLTLRYVDACEALKKLLEDIALVETV
jgi:hypothetical protein